MSEAKKPRQRTDWDAVEMHYRAGIRSLEDIGQEFGVSKGRISQVAKEKGWQRDLSAKIQARTEAKVQAQIAREALNEATLNDPAKQNARRLVEAEVVEANSDAQATVLYSQRKGLGRSVALQDKLFAEIEAVTDNVALFEKLGELMDESGEDANGKMVRDRLNEIYRKVISTPGRVDSFKKLVETQEKLVRMQREAFGIKSDEGGSSTVDDLLLKLGRGEL